MCRDLKPSHPLRTTNDCGRCRYDVNKGNASFENSSKNSILLNIDTYRSSYPSAVDRVRCVVSRNEHLQYEKVGLLELPEDNLL